MLQYIRNCCKFSIPLYVLHLAVFALSVISVWFLYSNALSYMEHFGLFIFDAEFLKNIVFAAPGSFLYAPSLFCTQFFYIPIAASIIFGSLLFVVYLLSFYVSLLCNINRNLSWAFAVLVVVLLFAYFSNSIEYLCNIWGIVLNLGVCSLLLLFLKKHDGFVFSWLVACLGLCILYFLSGGWFFIGCGLLLGFAICRGSKKSLWTVVAAVVCAISIPIILSVFSPMPIAQVWFNLVWFSPITFDFYRNAGFTYHLFMQLPSVLLLLFFCLPFLVLLNKKMGQAKKGVALWVVLLGLISSSLLCYTKYSPLPNLCGQMFKDAEIKNWDGLLKSCDMYWDERKKGDMAVGTFNDAAAATFTKWALIRTKKLNDIYFSYVMYPSMAPLFTNDRSDPVLISMFLEDMGVASEAFHLSTLPLYSYLYDLPLPLINMTKAGVAQGNYYSIQRPLEKLKKSIRYKPWADSIQKSCSTKAKKRVYADTTGPLFLIPSAGDATLFYYFLTDTSRTDLFDYTVLLAMLRKDLNGIAGSIAPYKQLHPNDMYLPVHVEEALLMFVGYNNQGSAYNSQNISGFKPDGFSIKEETINRCDYFMLKLQALQNGQFSQDAFSKEFGNTYWYYYLFADPSWNAI